MKILAIDSSGLVASVAVVEDDNMLAEYTINTPKAESSIVRIGMVRSPVALLVRSFPFVV